MQWMRRARTRRLTAGTALAATILHVAFLSLHIAMSASLAFAGDSGAVRQSRLAFVFCAPSKSANTDADRGADTNQTGEATFCPVCTSATSPAVVLPDLPPQPSYGAEHVVTVPAARTPAEPTTRHEVASKQSRGPPLLT